MDLAKTKIGIIGLGYVGLPLAIEFGKKIEVIGYDISSKRISELNNHFAASLEVEQEEFKESEFISFTDNSEALLECNVFIVTVPTPIDKNKRPN